MKIGEIMIQMGFINKNQLDKVIDEQEKSRKNSEYVETVGNIMLRKGLINEEQHNHALIEYFKYLTQDNEQPLYVRETARVAMSAIEKKANGNKLSEEGKMTILKKIHEYEEKIVYDEKSIGALSNLEPKKVIMDTIDKEKKEIKALLEKIETLKKDMDILS
jgi:hypothetical protein